MGCPCQHAQVERSPLLTSGSLVVTSIACWGHLNRSIARILPGRLVSSLPILPLLRLSGQVAGMLLMSARAAIHASVWLLLPRCWGSMSSPGRFCRRRADICGIRLRLPSRQGEEAVILCKRLRLLRCCAAAARVQCLAADTCLLIVEGCGGLRLQYSLGSVVGCVRGFLQAADPSIERSTLAGRMRNKEPCCMSQHSTKS